MLEDRGAQHDKEVVDKYADPTANYQMTTYDYVMRPSADANSGPITLTLPPVAEAKGRFYSIISRAADAVNTITINDLSDSECWSGPFVMNTRCERALMYSDGLAWIVMGEIGFRYTMAPTTLTPTTQIIG